MPREDFPRIPLKAPVMSTNLRLPFLHPASPSLLSLFLMLDIGSANPRIGL